MKNHPWRTTRTELTEGQRVQDAARRPVALGWKLEQGQITSSEVEAWRASVDRLVAHGAATLDQTTWVHSAPLRVLLDEYHKVLDGRRGVSGARKLGAMHGRGTDLKPPDTQS